VLEARGKERWTDGERERERETDGERERQRERERGLGKAYTLTHRAGKGIPW